MEEHDEGRSKRRESSKIINTNAADMKTSLKEIIEVLRYLIAGGGHKDGPPTHLSGEAGDYAMRSGGAIHQKPIRATQLPVTPPQRDNCYV